MDETKYKHHWLNSYITTKKILMILQFTNPDKNIL